MNSKPIIIVVEDGLVRNIFNLPEGVDCQIVELISDIICGCPENDNGERIAYGPNEYVDKQVCLNCGGMIDDDWLYSCSKGAAE